MIWLLGVVLLLQSCFYWVLKPAINFSTPFFELRGFGLLILFLGAWLLSGRSNR